MHGQHVTLHAGHPTVRIELDEAAARRATCQGTGPAGDAKGDGSGRTGEIEEALEVSGAPAQQLAEASRKWRARACAGDYVAIQAYIAPTEQSSAMLREIRRG